MPSKSPRHKTLNLCISDKQLTPCQKYLANAETTLVVVDLALSSENTDHSNSDYTRKSDTNVQGKYSRYYDRNDNNVRTKGNGNKIASRICVVDDDPDVVHVLKRGVLKNGLSVEGFTSPDETLLRFRSNAHDFCLIVSDIRMPGLSGI